MDRVFASALGTAVLLAALFPPPARAGTASARFDVRLVVEPACPGHAAKAVPDRQAALALARQHLGPGAVVVEHDVRDTGFWLVLVEGQPVLRIEKCTGAVGQPAAGLLSQGK